MTGLLIKLFIKNKKPISRLKYIYCCRAIISKMAIPRGFEPQTDGLEGAKSDLPKPKLLRRVLFFYNFL